ncbi:MAG: DUF5668 domain-containing protein [Bacteroidales bacterium]|nr:DUF5668 domain-containing protein [Bacteroidales bacterium]
MKKSSIIWGFILIIIGLLILLRSFDIIYFSWWTFWNLWPIVLILIGISIIPMKDWIKTTAIIVVMSISLLLIVRPNNGEHESFCHHFFNEWNFDDEDWDDWKDEIKGIKEELENMGDANYVTLFDANVTKVNLDVELTDCDSFSIKNNTNNNLIFETFGYSSYNLQSNTIDNEATCSITPINSDSKMSKAILRLDPYRTYALKIATKSEYNNYDFSDLDVSNLQLTAVDDNSFWKIKFGNKNANATVQLNTNDELDSIQIMLPTNMGISVTASDISDLPEWNGLKKSGTEWVSDNYSSATEKINMIVSKTENIVFNIQRF